MCTQKDMCIPKRVRVLQKYTCIANVCVKPPDKLLKERGAHSMDCDGYRSCNYIGFCSEKYAYEWVTEFSE